MDQRRFKFFLFFFGIINLLIIIRLFYWQIVKGNELSAVAKRQRVGVKETYSPRGTIYSNDNYPLAIDKPSFDLGLYLPNLDISDKEFSETVGPIIEATPSSLLSKINSGPKWMTVKRHLNSEQKEEISQLELKGISFDENSIRDYPEASMAAHLIGFVGSDKNGDPQGYYGLEGYYHQQLSGQPGLIIAENNPFGEIILSADHIEETMRPGMDLNLYLDRPVQFILEEELKKGIEKYGAISGWGIIMNPKNGAISAMASFPNYDPANFSQYEKKLYPNPAIVEGFEPGSIFKPLVMAAAIEENVVKPDTKCTFCDQPKKIGDHTIKTWDDNYHPDSTMTEVIQNSDNVGMVFVAEQLGKKNMLDYLDKYGFGKKTGIDLQEEAALPLRNHNQWYPIDIATLSFGQGISVTPIQLVTAFSGLANNGKIVKPRLVRQITDGTKIAHDYQTQITGQPLSEKTTALIKEMLVNAVENGGAKWTKLDDLAVAGKTGTAQIPIAGHYDKEKTIASFIGYAPADNPKFVMLISLREPSTSPWGSETAAPVWFNIADKLSYYWGLK
jgi:stage V sporulation protein D (sporulation-specific penicillin-binding protein)